MDSDLLKQNHSVKIYKSLKLHKISCHKEEKYQVKCKYESSIMQLKRENKFKHLE